MLAFIVIIPTFALVLLLGGVIAGRLSEEGAAKLQRFFCGERKSARSAGTETSARKNNADSVYHDSRKNARRGA